MKIVVCVKQVPDTETRVRSGPAPPAHVKAAALDATDPAGTARILAGAVRTLAPFDLVLCGQQGVGGDNSQIPGLLAELLDLPQVTGAGKIDVGGGRAVGG